MQKTVYRLYFIKTTYKLLFIIHEDGEKALDSLSKNKFKLLQVREAKNGADQSYADYNANPFAFSVGFEHFHQISKKKRQLVGYVCHGFERDDTGLVHSQ